MATHSFMAIFTTLLVLLALVWGAVASTALDSVDGYSVEFNSNDASADFSREVAPRADYECPAVCPACPALPGCPACPAAPPCPSAPPCPRRIPPGYLYYEGLGYYKMHYEVKAWDDAKAACEREGGYLAVLNSQSEANLASNLSTKHGLTDHVHVGFFDVTKKGKYITVLDGLVSSSGYTVWAPREPNGVGKEYCGSFLPNKGLNDEKCHRLLPFLCELFT